MNFRTLDQVDFQAPSPPGQPFASTHLGRLPAELRNNIYELVFTSDDDNEVELAAADPPSAAMIFTCRQTHNEARTLYREVRNHYWDATHFYVKDIVSEMIEPYTSNLMEAVVRRVKHLTLTGNPEACQWDHRVEYHRGIWSVSSRRGQGRRVRRYWILLPSEAHEDAWDVHKLKGDLRSETVQAVAQDGTLAVSAICMMMTYFFWSSTEREG